MWFPRPNGYDRGDETRHHSGSRHRRHKKSSVPNRLEPLDDRRHSRQRSRNQSDHEEDSYYYEDQRQRRKADRRYPPPMAMMYLPPLDYYGMHRKDSRRRRYDERRRSDRSSSSSSCSSSENDRVERGDRHRPVNLRSQRVRSLQAMAQLQRNAATVIQREFRFYRNRCRNQERLAAQLHERAAQYLEAFLSVDVLPHLVSETLLEVLKEQAQQQTMGGAGESALTAQAECVYHELLHSVVSDVFQAVVDSMVHEYIISRLDMTRASQPPTTAVAGDILGELVTELVSEVIPEALTEIVRDYISQRHVDEFWQEVVHEQLHDVSVDATVELAMEGILRRLEQYM